MFNLTTELLHVLVSVGAKFTCILLILLLAWSIFGKLLREVVHGSERFPHEGEDRIRAAVIEAIGYIVAAIILGFMIGGVY